jgi:glycerol-3-phosphate dehydrogenase subunit B
VGLPYAGSDPRGVNLILPSPAGAGRPAFLAPLAQRAGDLRQRQPMLVVGFTEMRDFYPHLIAENLAAQGHPARALLLPLDIISAAQDRNTVQLATTLDEEQVQRRLAETLRGLVAPGERIGLPAILGLHRHAEAMELIARVAGAPVFEIPTLPPSVPGIRLTTALRRHLGQLGVRVEVGMEAIGFEAAGDTIRWVETATSARPIRHQAQRFLLATGGVLGGGFDSDAQGRFWEVVFGLPLTTPQDRRQWFRPLFLDPAGQPVFHGGVRVDGCWQAVDAAGQPVYRNLWAAGGVLAHADPILERSLEGVGLATAFAAVGEMTRSE